MRFLRKDGQVVLAYSGLIVVDAGAREFEAAFERTDAGLRLRVADEGARYPLIIDRIAEQPYLKASNTDAGDQFGWSVSVSGDTVVVGARSEDSNATGVNGNQADCRDAMGSGAL